MTRILALIAIAASIAFPVFADSGCAAVLKSREMRLKAPGIREYSGRLDAATGEIKDEKLMGVITADTVYVKLGNDWQNMGSRKDVEGARQGVLAMSQYTSCKPVAREVVGGVQTTRYDVETTTAMGGAPVKNQMWIGDDGRLYKQVVRGIVVRLEYGTFEAPK